METLHLSCPHCGFAKEVEKKRIPAATRKIKCPKCQQSFPLEREFEFTPESASAVPGPEATPQPPRTPEQHSATSSFKYCSACGKQIHPSAEICPGCGVRVAAPAGAISKVALLLITFFLGGFGGHRFYQKKYGLGVLYLLFSWTYIPSLVALVEFILYAIKSEAELQQRYPESSSRAVVMAVIIPFIGIALIGILAAIAIPQYAAYREKAFEAAAKSDLITCRSSAESYFAEQGSYPMRSSELNCQASQGVALYYLAMGPGEFQLVGYHREGKKAFLQNSGEKEFLENSRLEIEGQLRQSYGNHVTGESFHFVE